MGRPVPRKRAVRRGRPGLGRRAARQNGGRAWLAESIVRNHLLPAIGERKLGSLTPRDIQAMVTAWSQTAAPRTVRRQYGVLTAIFNHAVASDLVGRTPARGVRLPNLADKRVRYVIGAEELASLVDALGDDYGPVAYLGTVLGLRWGECAGLKVGRVDFLGRTITVAEQRTRGLGGRMVECPPKSAAGQRTLSVPAALMTILSSTCAGAA